MRQHPYNTRSKASSSEIEFRASDSQERHSDGMSDEPEKKSNQPPSLLTLPDEVQTIIYKQLLVKPLPLDIHVFVGNLTKKAVGWRATTSIHGRHQARPPLLAVCKSLRKFALPIYFSENTFSMQGNQCDAQKVQVLRKMWGEDVKHIRKVELNVRVCVRYISTNFWDTGFEKPETVRITIAIHLLQRDKFIMARSSEGTKESSKLPNGLMCHCRLEILAARLQDQSHGNQWLFDLMAECAKQDDASALVRKCSRCGLPALVIFEYE